MGTNPQSNTSTLITWLVATIGGLSVVLYLAGVVAVTMRLIFYQLPYEDAIADLPQSYFATVALNQMLLPSLLVAGIYLLGRNLLQLSPFDSIRWFGQRRSLVGRPSSCTSYSCGVGTPASFGNSGSSAGALPSA